MAISKRTRFEVLRRDNHTCQYCGQMAPDVTLHIDHVEPVALGGSDKPDNLVTACKDCNLGKASIAPGSPLVESLSAKAAAYALGMTEKMTRIRGTIEAADEYAESFQEEWTSWLVGEVEVPLPIDWESTLHRWFRMGVPNRMLEVAIPKAMKLQFPQGEDARFKYLAGIIWRQIDEAEIDYTVTEETLHIYTKADVEGSLLPDAWEKGYRTGMAAGLDIQGKADEEAESQMDLLRHHIDGTSSPFFEAMRLFPALKLAS